VEQAIMEQLKSEPSFMRGSFKLIKPGSTRRKSAALLLLAAAATALVARLFTPALEKISPPCIFHSLTGLHCAGCGATRALIALLRGDIAAAFGYNPLFMIVFVPVVLLAVLNELTIAAAGTGFRASINPGARTVVIIIAILVAYSLLRNIPAWPFSYLAP
jgi:hypothetical protein